MPSNEIAKELISASGVPIAAPSANISGKPSGTRLSDIIEELKEKVDFMIDGGETDIGLESTVVRVMDNEVKILRPGKITKEEIEKVVTKVSIDKNVMGELQKNERVLSPGMKYRHYAPQTHCKLVYSKDNERMVKEIKSLASAQKKVLILALSENVFQYQQYPCINLGSKNHLEEVSHNLFSKLREIDDYHVDLAIIEGVEQSGMGLAIMNRFMRACEHDYIEINEE